MLTPVRETTRTESPKIDFAKGSIPHVFNDQLVSAKKTSKVYKWFETKLSKIWIWLKTAPALKGVRAIVTKVYNWLNYYLFSVFNDEREASNRLIKKLGKFRSVFYELEAAGTDAGRTSVKNKFRGLGSELQKLIKEEIFTVLKKDRPDKTDAELNQRVQEVLDNPFIDFAADHPVANENVNPMANHTIAPMGRAIYGAMQKLWNEK